MNITRALRVEPGTKVRLGDHDPGLTGRFRHKGAVAKRLARNLDRLADLQYRLYAEDRRALLIIFQAMDAGGKDGTIRHVMSGVNPQGCQVTSFKVPSAEELAHDFLWRIHKAAPRRGQIGIFNRSHYEDVLIVRVHGLVPKGVWSRRYDRINEFELGLTESGVTLLKFFLHISKEEQKKRFIERLADPTKNWKFSAGDVAERRRWDDYMAAYEAVLTRTSTPWAPWFIVPADRKWFRNFAVSEIIVETLAAMDPQFPPSAEDLSTMVIE